MYKWFGINLNVFCTFRIPLNIFWTHSGFNSFLAGSNVWWSFIARYISDFIRVCTRSLNFIIIIFGFTYLIRIFPGLHPKSKKINYSVSFLLNYKFEDMRFLLRVLCSPSSVASSTMKAFSSSVAIATLRVSSPCQSTC